ncbi:MAG: ferredoxin [Chloroflexota bacterium]|jgi:NAD-dependent dihydropyrimidine dehydrogenase PreA subunit
MTYVIAEPCVDTMDQACVAVCPVDCIHFGACEPECPVAAIFPEDSVPEDQARYTEVNALWFQDKDAARAIVNELKPA